MVDAGSKIMVDMLQSVNPAGGVTLAAALESTKPKEWTPHADTAGNGTLTVV